LVLTSFVVLTTQCDRVPRCPWCYYCVEPERLVPDALDTERMRLLIRDLSLAGVRTLYLTGGEPLLREDLDDIVAMATRHGMETVLLTNGRRLDVARLERLNRAGLSGLIVSIPDARSDDLALMGLLREAPPTSLIHVVTQDRASLVPEVVELARNAGLRLLLQPAWDPTRPHDVAELSAVRSWARWNGLEAYLDRWRGTNGPRSCAMGRDAIVVDADGVVYPCFHRRDLPCGNVLSEPLGGILERVACVTPRFADASCFGRHCVSLHVNTP